MLKLIFLVLFLCSSVHAQIAPKLIIGELDWTDVGHLAPQDPLRIAAGPIAYLSFNRLILSSRCTGFMITDDILMTNQHCIKGRFRARNLKAYFRFQSGQANHQRMMAECTDFLGSNEELDYSLIRCSGSPGRDYGKVRFGGDVEIGQPVYIVQQNCDVHTNRDCTPTKKVALGEVVHLVDNQVFHNVDTLGGSSGSPVFDRETNEVVALHRGGLGPLSNGRGQVNVAISIQEIKTDIQRRYPRLAREIFRP
jgi:V8-like Glu-specific endopeptidase